MAITAFIMLSIAAAAQAFTFTAVGRALHRRGMHDAVRRTHWLVALCALGLALALLAAWYATRPKAGGWEVVAIPTAPLALLAFGIASSIAWRHWLPFALFLYAGFATCAITVATWAVLGRLSGNTGNIVTEIAGWLIPIVVWHAFTLPSLLFWASHRPVPPGFCRECGYHLKGLSPDAPCPECGLVAPHLRPTPTS